MRKYSEPTARNLLRRPLVFGVPAFGLIALSCLVLSISILAGTGAYGNLIALGAGTLGYIGLRVITRFAKSGWEERIIWQVEKRVRVRDANGSFELFASSIDVIPPDTLDEAMLIASKEAITESIGSLKAGERKVFVCKVDSLGARLFEAETKGKFDLSYIEPWGETTKGLYEGNEYVYSLCLPPVVTDPLWIYGILSRIRTSLVVVVSVQGTDFHEIKRRIEGSRRSNSRGASALSDIDSDVSFEEASQVLRGLSRGDETVVEISLILISKEKLDLDTSLFCLEAEPALSVAAVLGLRKRLHRAHYVRAVTACDLIPNILDPVEPGPTILTTLRGKPLYFSPDDSRLEALHWLVVGASGSGKSFFTGLVIKRMMSGGSSLSVLFVDHNRSFRRLVRRFGETYLEPQNLNDLQTGMDGLFSFLERPRAMVGVELSDLPGLDKKAGIQCLLGRLEQFLRSRKSDHPIYVVLDECWNFMRDEPVLVQRAFREFRKLNGAAVAITQSLSDFLSDASGQSIFQNAPIRILLRQGEDLGAYQGILNLNSVELSLARALKQKRGSFSECLIKTPFLSRVGRLNPTEDEHELLRTDNLRAEIIAEARQRQSAEEIACLV